MHGLPFHIVTEKIAPCIDDENTLMTLLLGFCIPRIEVRACAYSWIARHTDPLWAVLKGPRRGFDTGFSNMTRLYMSRWDDFDVGRLSDAFRVTVFNEDREGYAALLRMGAPADRDIIYISLDPHLELDFYTDPVVMSAFFDTQPAQCRIDMFESLSELACKCKTKTSVHLVRGLFHVFPYTSEDLTRNENNKEAWIARIATKAMECRNTHVLRFCYLEHGTRAREDVTSSVLIHCVKKVQGNNFKDHRSGLPFFEAYLDLEEELAERESDANNRKIHSRSLDKRFWSNVASELKDDNGYDANMLFPARLNKRKALEKIYFLGLRERREKGICPSDANTTDIPFLEFLESEKIRKRNNRLVLVIFVLSMICSMCGFWTLYTRTN